MNDVVAEGTLLKTGCFEPILTSSLPAQDVAFVQPVEVDMAFEETLINHTGTNFGRNFVVGFFTFGIGNAFLTKSLGDEETVQVTVTRADESQKVYSASASKDFEGDQGGQIWKQTRIELRQDCIRMILEKMRADPPTGKGT